MERGSWRDIGKQLAFCRDSLQWQIVMKDVKTIIIPRMISEIFHKKFLCPVRKTGQKFKSFGDGDGVSEHYESLHVTDKNIQ